MNWISCKEKLPEHSEIYTVTVEALNDPDKPRFIDFAYFSDGSQMWFGDEYEYEKENECKVVAWMPAPPLYKGE